ncbi:GTP cyclohydrolase II [Nakamurella flava]|uniref:GTP cyclohydrolase II n=1 Tax=Nakamurella flava TaxID=2576308 RepID=UPI001F0FC818|nr:GTP cyclohydrolase II [Nakamurella flava]
MTSTRMPLAQGLFTAIGYRDRVTGDEIVALVMGLDVPGETDGPATAAGAGRSDGEPVPVRLHSECLTGDGFGSLRCDCGPQLQAALAVVAEAGRGVVVYLRGHEGRGIGLLDKLRAYRLQDAGADTVDANLALGLPEDAREYGGAVAVLTDLGVSAVALITNNPAKTRALTGGGVRVVRRLALPAAVTPANIGYLRTKRDRMHHQFGPSTAPGPDEATSRR